LESPPTTGRWIVPCLESEARSGAMPPVLNPNDRPDPAVESAVSPIKAKHFVDAELPPAKLRSEKADRSSIGFVGQSRGGWRWRKPEARSTKRTEDAEPAPGVVDKRGVRDGSTASQQKMAPRSKPSLAPQRAQLGRSRSMGVQPPRRRAAAIRPAVQIQVLSMGTRIRFPRWYRPGLGTPSLLALPSTTAA